MILKLVMTIGAIGCIVSLTWLGIAAFATWFYRPKKLTKSYKNFKA